MKKEVKQKEIEIKARLHCKDKLILKLKEISKLKKKYFKKDFYYAKSDEIKNNAVNIKNTIRLRVERGSYTFCSKIRNIVDSVEVNEEREFRVSKKKSREIIKFLNSIFDYSLYITKEKKGKSFIYKNTLIEISAIKGLGDFVELEIIENNSVDNITIDNKIKQLKSILYELNIPESDIETKPYIEIIAKNRV